MTATVRATSSKTARAGIGLESSEWYADDQNERGDLEHESHLNTTNQETHAVQKARVHIRREDITFTQVTHRADNPAASDSLASTSQPQSNLIARGNQDTDEVSTGMIDIRATRERMNRVRSLSRLIERKEREIKGGLKPGILKKRAEESRDSDRTSRESQMDKTGGTSEEHAYDDERRH